MPTLNRIFRRSELPPLVGLRRTQIDELISKGEFPRPIKLSDSGRAIAWLEADLAAWQAKRVAARDAVPPTQKHKAAKRQH
jgi:prophage regulatory protein